jgi:glycosyltransferase involved in cell wall biosynthesis
MNYTPSQSYKIILVDDCSSNKEFLGQFTQVRKKTIGVPAKKDDLGNRVQRGFAASVNAGIAAGSSPLICVVHSDIIIENVYWLLHLQEALGIGRNKDIKFVSSRLTNPGTCNDYPKELIYEKDEQIEEMVMPASKPLPWTCCLFNRKLLEIVGPLKEYPMAWYEDVEFFHRMKKHGYKQGIAMNSVVQHQGGKTINALIKERASNKELMESNSMKCIDDIKSLISKV